MQERLFDGGAGVPLGPLHGHTVVVWAPRGDVGLHPVRMTTERGGDHRVGQVFAQQPDACQQIRTNQKFIPPQINKAYLNGDSGFKQLSMSINFVCLEGK